MGFFSWQWSWWYSRNFNWTSLTDIFTGLGREHGIRYRCWCWAGIEEHSSFTHFTRTSTDCLPGHPVKQSRRQFFCGACAKPFRILPSFFAGLINIKDVALLLRINKWVNDIWHDTKPNDPSPSPASLWSQVVSRGVWKPTPSTCFTKFATPLSGFLLSVVSCLLSCCARHIMIIYQSPHWVHHILSSRGCGAA